MCVYIYTYSEKGGIKAVVIRKGFMAEGSFELKWPLKEILDM